MQIPALLWQRLWTCGGGGGGLEVHNFYKRRKESSGLHFEKQYSKDQQEILTEEWFSLYPFIFFTIPSK